MIDPYTETQYRFYISQPLTLNKLLLTRLMIIFLLVSMLPIISHLHLGIVRVSLVDILDQPNLHLQAMLNLLMYPMSGLHHWTSRMTAIVLWRVLLPSSTGNTHRSEKNLWSLDVANIAWKSLPKIHALTQLTRICRPISLAALSLNGWSFYFM